MSVQMSPGFPGYNKDRGDSPKKWHLAVVVEEPEGSEREGTTQIHTQLDTRDKRTQHTHIEE